MDLEGIGRRLRRHPVAADALLATALLVFTLLIQLPLVVPVATGAPSAPVIVAWAALLIAPLALRRRLPVAVLTVTALHVPFYWAGGRANEVGMWLVLGVAIYSAAAHGRRPLAPRVCATFAVLHAATHFAAAVAGMGMPPAAGVGAVLFGLVPFALGWLLGSTVRSLRATRAALEQRNRQLEDERRINAEHAVVEERLRIARELHDVVAHHVSVIGVQAGVARRLFDRRPAQAAAAIASVERTSRQTIGELHLIVGFLRRGDGDHDLTPQPRLAALPDLVARMRDAGLRARYVVEGRERDHPPQVELTAFRVVQEALTNVRRHAGAVATTVTVVHRDDGLALEVCNEAGDGDAMWPGTAGDGTGGTATHAGNGSGDGNGTGDGRRTGGTGLLGMRERVTMHGGRLTVGPRPGGGFRVHAVVYDAGTATGDAATTDAGA